MSGFDIQEVDGYNLTALKIILNESSIGDKIRIIKGSKKEKIPLGVYEVVDAPNAKVSYGSNLILSENIKGLKEEEQQSKKNNYKS